MQETFLDIKVYQLSLQSSMTLHHTLACIETLYDFVDGLNSLHKDVCMMGNHFQIMHCFLSIKTSTI